MLSKTAKFILGLITLLLLSSCGFKLRGHDALPAPFKVMYVRSYNPYDSFTKQLIRTLQKRGTIITQSPCNAPLTLDIMNDLITRQTSTISASTQLIQYKLVETVTYQLLDKRGNVITPPQSITTSRTYSVNINQMLAGNDAQTQLLPDMRRDIIFQLMLRLSSQETLRAIKCSNCL